MCQKAGGEADAPNGALRVRRPQEEGLHYSALTDRTHLSCPGSRETQLHSGGSGEAPDRLWVADITYIRTWEGWLYLSFVLDTYSRRIVGWSMANNLRTELVLDAVNMAIYIRRPSPGLIHHSDRGSQYTSVEFGSRLKEAGLLPSMGSVADAYDNSMAESFVSTLKRELIHRHSWPSRQRARTAIFEYIEGFYNTRRRHSALGHLSPSEYEEVRLKGGAVA
jgi:putative transposase